MKVDQASYVVCVLLVSLLFLPAGDLHGDEVVELSAQLKDKDFRVRIIAAQKLGDLGPKAAEAKDALIGALRMTDYNTGRDHPALVSALLEIGVDPKLLIVDRVLKAD